MIRKNYKLPPSYSLGSPGCGSFLEPPNHHRHFTRSIFTRFGNSPSRGPSYLYNGIAADKLEEIDRYFKPLPYNHPRTQAWEKELYSYFSNSYSKDGTDRNVSNSVIYQKHADSFTQTHPETWTTQPQPPEHHLAYLTVKKYYPEAKPRLDYIENKPQTDGSWYETLETKPTPENCPGDESLRAKHPVNGTWCQVCGWHQTLTKEA